MYYASVGCVPCAVEFGEVSAPSLEELGAVVTSYLVSCHSTPPHCPHTLRVDFRGPSSTATPLVISCLAGDRCPAQEKELRTEVPPTLVGALTILFHTSHEGHPIKIEYDGRTWSSPR